MTPFQAAWSLLKTEINPKPHPSDYPALRYMNHSTSPDARRQQFQRDQRNLFNAGIKNNNERTPYADKLMARLMAGETLSTDEINRLIPDIDGIDNKEDLNERSIDRGWSEEEDERAVREFVRNQPQKPNFGIPINTEQTRLRFDQDSYEPTPLDYQRSEDSFDRLRTTRDDWPEPPYRVGATPYEVGSEGMQQRAGRRLKDQRAAAKLHLQDNPPRLERDDSYSSDGNLYTIMSGNKDLGNVGVNNERGIAYGEVKPAYQRQGLYGKTLQGIINERDILHSNNRNQNSQPFHEQFNPPNTGKNVQSHYNSGGDLDENATHTYDALPPQETPQNWGDLQYDTGALPIYQQKPVEERNAISPRGDGKQASLQQWAGYMKLPGEQTYI